MKIFIATKNPHKMTELSRILEPMGFEVLCERDWKDPLPEVEETGTTFEENALLKAKSGLLATGLITVADDSGLCVDALDGAPGLYTARYSGEHATAKSNNEKLLQEMKEVPEEKRTATFVCAVACVFPDGREFAVRGECPGKIAFSQSPNEGFGYDPLFLCEKGCFADIPPEEKDAISHRGRALERFRTEMKKYMENGDNQC